MAHEQAPAFQFYPKDFMMDGRVASMTLEERGAYITLLCLCWTETTLPVDPKRLAQMIGCSRVAFRRVWPALQACFCQVDGQLRHGRLDKERQNQATYKAKQKAKADKRWADATASSRHMPEPSRTDGLLSASPVSDLQSSKDSLDSESAQMPVFRKPGDSIAYVPPPEEIQERAARLVERYGELFTQHRLGAKYRARPNLDYEDAKTLVPLWDDGRLDKLAAIVLTTEDEWISRTDRSFKIFTMKATWADDRLRAWEAEHGISA